MFLSIADVKNDLPVISVKYKGKEYIGHVRGRKEPFALVFILNVGVSAFFSWNAVARAYNTGRSLSMGTQ